MGKDIFETTDGRKIRMNKDWFKAKQSWPYDIDNIKDFVERVFEGESEYPVNVKFFLNKVIAFNYFYEFMQDNLMKNLKFDRILDIGTGPAIKPRLMKGKGIGKKVFGIDITDRSSEYSNEIFNKYIEYIKNNILLEDRGKKVLKHVTNLMGKRLGTHYPLHTLNTLKKEDSYELDKYIVDDFFNFKTESKFDLITGFMCIEYFEVKKLFERITELLNENGLFFVIVRNWYSVFGGSMELPMDSPWLHARTTDDDFKRYYEEIRPDIEKHAKKCMYFGTTHMSANDYLKYAKDKNLELVSYKRVLEKNVMEHFLYNDDSLKKYFYNTVLPEAKEINSNLRLSDLFTKYHIMLFCKK